LLLLLLFLLLPPQLMLLHSSTCKYPQAATTTTTTDASFFFFFFFFDYYYYYYCKLYKKPTFPKQDSYTTTTTTTKSNTATTTAAPQDKCADRGADKCCSWCQTCCLPDFPTSSLLPFFFSKFFWFCSFPFSHCQTLSLYLSLSVAVCLHVTVPCRATPFSSPSLVAAP
jgi:hypothetical protein